MADQYANIASRFTRLKPRYDLLVVGGGIYGAALLWEASRHGLSAVLIERGDYAGGASANSLKIIHGGIRYLQQLDIARIRGSAREQRFFLRHMPHLVRPLACLSPTYGHGTQSREAFQVAFWAYRLLCRDLLRPDGERQAVPQSGRILGPDALRREFPGLDATGANGTARWHDAIALDTERVVLTFVAEAARMGADSFNYAEMSAFVTRGSRVVGVKAVDRLNGEEVEIFADRVATCTGDASTDMKNLTLPTAVFGPMRFARAVNVILSRPSATHALALRASTGSGGGRRGRLLFFVPWQNATMVGTWYFQDKPEGGGRRSLDPEEVEQIVRHINNAYPAMAITPDDITFIHLGRLPARPRMSPDGEPLLLNHGLILDHGQCSGWDGLWSIVGVKFTTARGFARKALHRMFGKQLSRRNHAGATFRPDPAGHPSIGAVQALETGGKAAVTPATLDGIAAAYGGWAPEVLDQTRQDPDGLLCVPGAGAVARAALYYSVRNESVWHLSDLLLRRSNIGASACPARETVEWAADLMERHFNWGADRRHSEIEDLYRQYHWWETP